MRKKNRIREKIRKIRERMNEDEWKKKSLKIQLKFLSLPFYKNSKVIFTYFHFDREVKTDLIIKNSFEDGKIVCLPFIDWKNRNLIPSQIKSLNEIIKIKGIPGPVFLNPVEKEKIDIVIVPGVVFDIFKNRIGMGGGFYDIFLKDLPEKTKKVALAFEFQVFEEKIPVDEKDIKVDLIITENRIIE